VNGAPAAVQARDLVHRYGARRVLEHLGFEFEAPLVVAIRGSNGAGKSTLLKIIAGLLRPSAGALNVRIDGREAPPLTRHRWIGYAAPDLSFYPEFTAGENLMFAAETRGLASPPRAAEQALERVGLESRRDDRVSALSSGMLQRLRLAFALLADPPVVLLDEPGSHLDEAGRTMLTDLVGALRADRLVMIATNEEREGALADRKVELAGRGLGDPA
jgi:ABC-type multidrug transport system ATPase subunit